MILKVTKTVKYRFPIYEMNPGDCFLFPRALRKYIHQYMNKFNKRKNGVYEPEYRGKDIYINRVS